MTTADVQYITRYTGPEQRQWLSIDIGVFMNAIWAGRDK